MPQVVERRREWWRCKLGLELGDASEIGFALGSLESPAQGVLPGLVAVCGREMEVALGVDRQVFGERGVKDFSSSRYVLTCSYTPRPGLSRTFRAFSGVHGNGEPSTVMPSLHRSSLATI